MINIVYLLTGIIAGGLLAFLFFQSKRKTIETELLLARRELDSEQKGKADVQSQLDVARDDAAENARQLTQSQVRIGELEAQLRAEQRRYDEAQQLWREEMEERQQQQMQRQQEQRAQFDEQLQTVREQFKNLAAQVLDTSAERLKTQNRESMSMLTQPLKDNLEKLGKAIQATNQESARNTASLTEQLKAMAEQTEKIDKTATQLTSVMRGSSKIQGNWGELILTEILEQNGLVEGVNYDVQHTLTDAKGNVLKGDESGKRMIPDVILHYPKNEDVVIDAKMSIEAYERWMSAEDDALRKKYADDLARAVRTQMMGLAKKDYSSYIKPPRRAIDFVIMFVPNEGALQLALATDKSLWNDAFNQQVFITSQQNLMAILKIIQIAWRQYIQSENQQKIYGLAEELLKRVGEFVQRMELIKKDITTLGDHYDDVYKKAFSGNKSIVQKANELKKLGVKENAKYPVPAIEE